MTAFPSMRGVRSLIGTSLQTVMLEVIDIFDEENGYGGLRNKGQTKHWTVHTKAQQERRLECQ
jgi:hypothetical protein